MKARPTLRGEPANERRCARVDMLRDLARHDTARMDRVSNDAPPAKRRRGLRAARAAWGFTHYALIVAAVALAGFFGGAFLNFVERVEIYAAAAPANAERADAIVVLTGGPNRLAAAGDLLEAERAGHLLVSGVNLQTTELQVRDLLDIGDDLFACCVDLGFEAHDTRGNAREGARWFASLTDEASGEIGLGDAQRVIVVTSNYHMQRSLYEFRRLMPDVELVPHAVTGLDVENGKWWREAGNWRLLMGEFAKLTLARLRDYPRVTLVVESLLGPLRPVPTAEAAQ